MNIIQIQLPPELQRDIDFLKAKIEHLEKNLQPKDPTTYLTRQAVADMLHVDLSTVHNLTTKGILVKWAIGGRVFYKRDQVENAIVQIKK